MFATLYIIPIQYHKQRAETAERIIYIIYMIYFDIFKCTTLHALSMHQEEERLTTNKMRKCTLS